MLLINKPKTNIIQFPINAKMKLRMMKIKRLQASNTYESIERPTTATRNNMLMLSTIFSPLLYSLGFIGFILLAIN